MAYKDEEMQIYTMKALKADEEVMNFCTYPEIEKKIIEEKEKVVLKNATFEISFKKNGESCFFVTHKGKVILCAYARELKNFIMRQKVKMVK